MNVKSINFVLNDKPVSYDVPVHWTLLRLLRDGLGMTGTKCSCEEGECGACTVIFEGATVTSCLILAVDADKKNIFTVEGLAKGDELHPLQQAFIAKGAIQCGFCTPGMLLSAKALLDKNPDPSVEEIRLAMYGNLCRCTGYEKIIEAIQSVAKGETFLVEDGVWQAVEAVQAHGHQ